MTTPILKARIRRKGLKPRRAINIYPDQHNIKTTQKEANPFTPVSLLLETQYLHLATFNLLPPSFSSSSFSLSHSYIFLTVPALSRIDFSLRSNSLPSLKEGRKEVVCVFSLKFLSQNYNTLKGKLTVMKKQCLVNGVSSPSPHGLLLGQCTQRSQRSSTTAYGSMHLNTKP